MLTFSLPKIGMIELAIYDLSGREVANLAKGMFTGGVHSAVWNGLDGSGSRATGGIYLAILKAGEERLLQKIVLVR